MEILIPLMLGLFSSFLVLLISVTMIHSGESMKWYAMNTFTVSFVAETLEVIGEIGDRLKWDRSVFTWRVTHSLVAFFDLWYFVHVRVVFMSALIELYVLYHPNNKFQSFFHRKIVLHLSLPVLSIAMSLPSALLTLVNGITHSIIVIQYALVLTLINFASLSMSIFMIFVIHKSSCKSNCGRMFKKRMIAFTIYFVPANVVDIPLLFSTACLVIHTLLKAPMHRTEEKIIKFTEEIKLYHITVLATSSIVAFAPYRKAVTNLIMKLNCIKKFHDPVSTVVSLLERKAEIRTNTNVLTKQAPRIQNIRRGRVSPIPRRMPIRIRPAVTRKDKHKNYFSHPPCYSTNRRKKSELFMICK